MANKYPYQQPYPPAGPGRFGQPNASASAAQSSMGGHFIRAGPSGGPGAMQFFDPELEAQIAEQQSIYSQEHKDFRKFANKAKWDDKEKKTTVVREGGGKVWDDQTLLEWDPAHFRLFCGDLGGEVTDDVLFKAFGAYPSLQKARVVRDKKTTKSKGFGFVSFSDPTDFMRAWKEMNGSYIGSHPVKLRKAQTEIKASTMDKKGDRKAPYDKKNRGKHVKR